MPARPRSAPTSRSAAAGTDRDDLDGTPALVLLVGDEEYLVSRRMAEVVAAARKLDPAVEVSEVAGAAVEIADLAELLGPSLFGDRRVVLVRSAQDLRSGVLPTLTGYLADPTEGVTLVLHHSGGGKGKVVLDTARAAGARELSCARLTRPEERAQFVREEVRRAGGSISAEAIPLLVDAVGSDLRELAAVARQLCADCGGRVDAEDVAVYHRGRAEVTGFAVADLAVVGNTGAALEALRWALSVGVPHVVVADAMADGVRTVARVSAAGRGDPYAMATRLGLPAWKVKRAQGQARGWNEDGLRRALAVVAALNADVKGAAVDPAWALELAVRRLAEARALG